MISVSAAKSPSISRSIRRTSTGEEEGRLVVGDSAISGVWRADLESTTIFDAAVSNVHLFINDGPEEIEAASLGSFNATENLVQQTTGLWDGDYTLNVLVPEPGSMAIWGLGLLALIAIRRRRK